MTITTKDITLAFAEANPSLDKEDIQRGDAFEQSIFDHACLLNPELTADMNFRIKDNARYKVENGRLIVSYLELDNVDDFKRLAAIYQSTYQDLDVRVTDMHVPDKTKQDGSNKKSVYFALSFNAAAFMNHVIPNLTKPADSNNLKVQPEDFDFRPTFRGGHVYPITSTLAENKSLRQKQALESEKSALIETIKACCANTAFWSEKVRSGYGVQTNSGVLPDGVAKILDLIENTRNLTPDALLTKIVEEATRKHSENFQFLHSFFRGRDNKTNEFYGILKDLLASPSSQTMSVKLTEFLPKDASDELQLSSQ